MKRFLLLFCFILSGNLMLSAQTGRITGVITDQISKERIPFATVSLMDSNSNLVAGSVSNSNGNFTIEEVKFGKYSILVCFMGYRNDTVRNILVSKQASKLNLGSIQLSPVSIDVQEVQVMANAKTSGNKIDRQTYRAADFATASGGTATDLLSKLPSVAVDPDGSISVRGTTDFVVYLNGKPTLLDPTSLLGQISGSQIENVEIISIPTARYDAQGKGGIININTKMTGKEGWSVSVNGLTGGAPWSNLTGAYSGFKLNDSRNGAGVNLVFFKNNLTLYGGLNYNHRNVNGRRIGDARILVKENTYRHMIADGQRPEWYEYRSASLGIDYRLSKQSALSASWFLGDRNEGRSAFYIYDIFYADKNLVSVPGTERKEAWIYNPNSDTRFGSFNSYNLDYSHSFSKTSDLKVSAMYEHSGLKRVLNNQNFQFNQSSHQPGAIELEYRQTDDTPLNGFRLSVDYSTQLENGSRLNLGFQPQYLAVAGNFRYDTLGISTGRFYPYTDLQNGIDLNRSIYAAYADYSGAQKRLKYIVGLRVEYADQAVNLASANYFSLFEGVKKSGYREHQLDLFPNLHLDWELSPKDKFTLAASRRVSRPPAKNMAPFLYRRHLEVYEVGDPQLRPEYLVSTEVSWDRKFKRHNITLTGFYRGVNNAVFRVNTVTNENPAVLAVTREEVLIRSYTNAGNSASLGAEVNANIDGGKHAKFFLGGSLFNYQVKGDIFGYRVDNSSFNWSVKSNANLVFTKELKLALDFSLKSATVTAQGRNDLFYLVNANFTYTPVRLKDWDLSLRVLDLFNSNTEGLDTQAFNKLGREIFYQETTYFRKGGIIELGLTYTLNKKGKSSTKADSTFGKEQF